MLYILCPAESISGGPELAHQFCSAVNRLTDQKMKMCYVDVCQPLESCLPIDVNCQIPYEIYNTEHVCSISDMDREENTVVFPEGLTKSVKLFKKAKCVIWWMSVDNYFTATKGSNLKELKEKIKLHFVQSFYAQDFVRKEFPDSKCVYLSDYINTEHGKFLFPAQYREKYALFNPLKGYQKLKPLMEYSSWLKWQPLSGYGLEETIVLMQNAMIYVDFGNHPGKDRIPREAAVNGCCVITNREGSAAYHEDVPIPEEYKFADPGNCLEEIDHLLHDICDDFSTHQDRFAAYRDWIHGEKERFERECVNAVAEIKNL